MVQFKLYGLFRFVYSTCLLHCISLSSVVLEQQCRGLSTVLVIYIIVLCIVNAMIQCQCQGVVSVVACSVSGRVQCQCQCVVSVLACSVSVNVQCQSQGVVSVCVQFQCQGVVLVLPCLVSARAQFQCYVVASALGCSAGVMVQLACQRQLQCYGVLSVLECSVSASVQFRCYYSVVLYTAHVGYIIFQVHVSGLAVLFTLLAIHQRYIMYNACVMF